MMRAIVPDHTRGLTELRSLRWPLGLVLSTLAATGSIVLPSDNPVRALVILWFLAVCPGMALIRLIRVPSEAARWTLAIALSTSLDVLVALAMIYSGVWSPTLGFAVLAAATISGAAAQVRPIRETGRNMLAEYSLAVVGAVSRIAKPSMRVARVVAWMFVVLVLVSLDDVRAAAALAGIPKLPGLAFELLAGDQAPRLGLLLGVLAAGLLAEREIGRYNDRNPLLISGRGRDVVVMVVVVAFGIALVIRSARLARII